MRIPRNPKSLWIVFRMVALRSAPHWLDIKYQEGTDGNA